MIRLGRLWVATGLLAGMASVSGAGQKHPAAAPSPPSDDRAFSLNTGQMTWRLMEPQMGAASPQQALLQQDPVTGARRFMVRLPRNFHVPAHWHTANETHTVISGTFIMEARGKRVVLHPGGFNYTRGGTVHEAWTAPAEGALLFVTVDGRYDLRTDGPAQK